MTFKTSDGGSVSAHRVIVAAGSRVFHAMLYVNMKESSQKEIELPNIDSSTLKMLFRFFYTGHVKASVASCLKLLQAADYFNVSELETVCIDIIEKLLSMDNCHHITAFAVKHEFKSLLTACISFMEEWASFLVYCDFDVDHDEPFPLPAIVAFLKSSNLEVFELDLFLGIVEWYELQKDMLNSDDIKSLFKLIRYPLIQKKDLVEKVHPTNMADPVLYKAALEYHETNKFDGPEEQITVRTFYFDFDSVHDSVIEHTPKGTIITSHQSYRKCKCMVLLDFDITIRFVFCLKSCRNKRKTKLFLSHGTESSEDDSIESVEDLPIGEEIEGSFFWLDDNLHFELGEVMLSLLDDPYGVYYFGITLYSEGDQISILKTYHT